MNKLTRCHRLGALAISAAMLGVLFALTTAVRSAGADVPRAVASVGNGGATAHALAVRVAIPTAPLPPGPSAGHFSTLPPGAVLPSDETCASLVRSAAELRPINAVANHTVGTGSQTVGTGLHPVTGNFTGTTDELIQWAACKWGIDEDVARAQIAKESWWHQDSVGDAGESFGLGQVRITYHADAFIDNNALKSSAYNLDYTYAVWRTCYNGELTWLNTVERGDTYAAGDMWGCVGTWFAGRWKTAPANDYIAAVQAYLSQKIWQTADFQNG